MNINMPHGISVIYFYDEMTAVCTEQASGKALAPACD